MKSRTIEDLLDSFILSSDPLCFFFFCEKKKKKLTLTLLTTIVVFSLNELKESLPNFFFLLIDRVLFFLAHNKCLGPGSPCPF